MIFLGNYANWIQPKWIEFMKSHSGHSHPRLDTDEYGSGNQNTLAKVIKFNKEVLWHSFESDNFPFEVELPIEQSGRVDWWFVKMLTGDLIPFHSDHAPRDSNQFTQTRRFWMPLTDYVEGHVFVVEEQFLKNYSAGDLFEYAPNGRHGGYNINLDVPRYTFNFAMYI